MSFVPVIAAAVAESGASIAAAGTAATGVVAAAGTGAVLGAAASIGATYTAGASSRYSTLRHQDRNADLIGEDDRPILVNEPLMNSLQGEFYVFTVQRYQSSQSSLFHSSIYRRRLHNLNNFFFFKQFEF